MYFVVDTVCNVIFITLNNINIRWFRNILFQVRSTITFAISSWMKSVGWFTTQTCISHIKWIIITHYKEQSINEIASQCKSEHLKNITCPYDPFRHVFIYYTTVPNDDTTFKISIYLMIKTESWIFLVWYQTYSVSQNKVLPSEKKYLKILLIISESFFIYDINIV